MTAQEALDIILPIPAEKFMLGRYGDDKGNSCVLGHIHRVKTGDPEDYMGDCNGFGLRERSTLFMMNTHPDIKKYFDMSDDDTIETVPDIADINNEAIYNGYTEENIKDRVVHFLTDMVAAGY
jgi:hypothetical protein